MDEGKTSKLNLLNKSLPQGLLVDAAWLQRKGISSSLLRHYVKSGWLERPAHGVYRRPPVRLGEGDVPLDWRKVVVSLQTLLECPLIVGGMTALDLHGYAHYLAASPRTVHLYGRIKTPGWLNKLGLPQRFAIHNSDALFSDVPVSVGLGNLAVDIETGAIRDRTSFRGGGIETMAWSPLDWPLTLSSPERAFLEYLDELPGDASFHEADMTMQGAANFRPTQLGKLLQRCKSIKVKRLFFFFADRHGHAWRKYLNPQEYDLGSGKRMLVRGGKLDPVYLITVPDDLDAER